MLTVLAFARSTSGFYFGELLAGLTREVARRHGRVIIVQTLDPNDVADVVLRSPSFDLPVAWDEIDGAVAMSLAADRPMLQRLRDAGKPVVLTHAVEGFDAPLVLPNNRGSVHAAIEHLVAHGHRRIGFVGSTIQHDLRERYAAYLEAVDAGVVAQAQFFATDDYHRRGGFTVAEAVARCPDRPTALVVATDRNALGLLDGLASQGIRVPQDMAMIGLDNIEAGVFSTPTLSSVSLRFDQVGALAGRVLLDEIAGDAAGASTSGRLATVHPTASLLTSRPTAPVVAARGSCGCTTDPFTSGAAPATRADTPVDVLGSQLTSLLRDTLAYELSGQVVDDDARAGALAAVEHLSGAVAPTTAEMQSLLTSLSLLTERPELLHRVANTIAEHLQRDGSPPRAELTALAMALWRLQAAAYLHRSEGQERLLTEQFRIAADLLQASSEDPHDLSWLGSTHVRGGALALWTGDPADGLLQVVGMYDPESAMDEAVGAPVRVTSFPPSGLINLARPERREACFVVPVQTAEHHWGLLAVVGDIDTTSSRDTYHHWAALLCSAFEEEQLERAKRESEERYALAARAAHDGLWEVDLTTCELYASSRFRELLGPTGSHLLTPVDCLERIHPDDAAAVDATIARARQEPDAAVEVEFRIRDGDGWRWVQSRGLGVPARDGHVARLVGSLSDIHPRKLLEEQLRLGALYDSVTGLPNRRLFLERLRMTILQARRRATAGYAVIFLDLDGFKLVNDSLGHLVGDQLLKVVAERLRAELRDVDIAARFGGDEFAVLLCDPMADEVLAIARRIQERIAASVMLAGHEVSITASVGIATSSTGYADAEEVLRDSDIAMYEAKAAQRGSASVFDPQMHARASGRLRARAEVRAALAEQQFQVHYQPIVDLDGSGLGHFEALIRWRHPERGLLLPGAFLPTMEDTSTIVALGRWILDEVCRQVAQWNDEGLTAAVSVNLSHQEFWSRDLVLEVGAALARHAIPPEQLVLEITESVIMTDAAPALAVMADLHALGVLLHIDDFGTGQSSLHALRSFPVDALKIDGSFIRELGVEDQTTELVRIIIEIGRVLGLSVVAECVETPEQAERLREMGCGQAQGWLYARALPGDEAGALLGQPLALVH